MPALGLFLLFLYGLLAIGMRMVVQFRRTGSTGLRGRPLPAAMELVSGLILVIAAGLSVGGTVLQATHSLGSLAPLDSGLARALGAILASLGIVITVVAQFAMGETWRIGVDPTASTELISDGPFALVRNPIFAAMVAAFAGFALLAPSVATIAAAILVFLGLELQTRLIEEPYMTKRHGELYAAYAARTGRFLPGLGRLDIDRQTSRATPTD